MLSKSFTGDMAACRCWMRRRLQGLLRGCAINHRTHWLGVECCAGSNHRLSSSHYLRFVRVSLQCTPNAPILFSILATTPPPVRCPRSCRVVLTCPRLIFSQNSAPWRPRCLIPPRRRRQNASTRAHSPGVDAAPPRLRDRQAVDKQFRDYQNRSEKEEVISRTGQS